MSRPPRSAVAQACAPAEAPLDAATPVQVVDPGLPAEIGWLRTTLRRRFSAAFADDLAQETFLRLAQRPGPAPASNLRGLLVAIAANLARDAFRRDRVRAAHASGPLAAAGPSPLTAEDDLAVRQAILALPPKLREVLLLSKIGGLTNREIAQRYGLSTRAIDKRLQKALTLLVAKLRD